MCLVSVLLSLLRAPDGEACDMKHRHQKPSISTSQSLWIQLELKHGSSVRVACHAASCACTYMVLTSL